jgi:hypothetical protein
MPKMFHSGASLMAVYVYGRYFMLNGLERAKIFIA